MPFVTNWDDFASAAEILYLNDPMKARFTLKYRHCDGKLVAKMTDNTSCLLYKTEHSHDIKKIEKFNSQLMRHMASKEK